MLEILERNGARYIHDWIEESALVDGVRKAKLCHAEMILIHQMLTGPKGHTFIEGLPPAVRGEQNPIGSGFGGITAKAMTDLGGACASSVDILYHMQRAMLTGPKGYTFIEGLPPAVRVVQNLIEGLPSAVRGVQNLIGSGFWLITAKAMTGLGGARASSADILHHMQRAVDLAGIGRNIKATAGIIDPSDLKAIMLKLPTTKPWYLSKATELFRSLQSLSEGAGENASVHPTDGEDAWNTSVVVDLIEPCIYAGTPMCAALQDMVNLFQNADNDNNILFILSDWASADGDPCQLAASLK